MKKLEFLKQGLGPQQLIERKSMAKKFYSNVNPPPVYFEKYRGVSITQQDPGLSIREMVERYARGESLMGHTDVYYDGEFDEDIDNIQIIPHDVDLADISAANDAAEAADKKVKEAKEAVDKARKRRSAAPNTKDSLKGNVERGEDDKGRRTAKDDDPGDVPGESQAALRSKQP